MNRDLRRQPLAAPGTTNTLHVVAEKVPGKAASAASRNQLARQMRFNSSTIAELPAGHDRTVYEEHF